VQLRSSAIAEPGSSDWLEIAPRLRDEPLQIDLVGGPVPEVLVDNALSLRVPTIRYVCSFSPILRQTPDGPGPQILVARRTTIASSWPTGESTHWVG
jgi:hypothetical protein